MDPKFKPVVRQELKKLGENMRTMHSHQNKNYWDTTQEKWDPEGRKAKAAAAAKVRKKNVNDTQKETGAKGKDHREIVKDDGKMEPAETEAKVGIEKLPDEKTEASNEESECGRGLDNRKSAVEDGSDAADNRDTDKDSDPAPTSKGTDSVASNRSEDDKGTEKGKCQSSVAPEPGRASEGNKDTSDNREEEGGTSSAQSKAEELQAKGGERK